MVLNQVFHQYHRRSKEVLDLPLLRDLQEIAAIERESALEFVLEEVKGRTDATYDYVILVDQTLVDGVDLDTNVANGFVWVRQRTLKAVRDGTGEETTTIIFETNSLTRALVVAYFSVRNWTIFLTNGLFVDPHIAKWPSQDEPAPATAPNLEIVGLGDARILFTGSSKFQQIGVGWGKLTLKRLKIYDFRREINRRTPLISVFEGAQLELIDVKITTPRVGSVYLSKGSVATLKKCSFYNCLHAILNIGGKAHVEDCLFSHCGTKLFRTIGTLHSGTLSASRIRFVDCSWIAVWVDSHTTFDHCQFEIRERSHYASHADVRKYSACACIQSMLIIDFHLFYLSAGSTAICNNCDFRGYDGVSIEEGSKTNLSVISCRISTVVAVAQLKENASVEVTNCHIDTVYLMKIGYNVKGKVTFANNKLSGTTKRLFLADDMSKLLLRDLKLKGMQLKGALFADIHFSPHDQIQSSYTKKFIAQRLRAPEENDAPAFDNTKMKSCGFCTKSEGEEAILSHSKGEKVKPVVSFRFCSKCRQVCYCSPECQKKHWRDHKLSCPDRATSKSTLSLLKKMKHRH